jgi:DNA-binding XRE family transcriptional regulator
VQARDVIVVARRRAGLTQARLAAALGVAVETLAAWESGADDPSYRQVQDVVALCGFDLHVGLPHADARTIRLDGFDVTVASLVDLLRIDQAGDGHHVGVLIATLAGVRRDEP